ncbi:MAG: hypothetical protein H6922_02755 [Pseudomonadaceae bacterium]|nr:hypothetical protein [Pseudomonadaceae bacterium]
MTLYVGIVSVVLLALVAGLLLTVGWWLYEFRQSYKKIPLLGEELTRQLMQAREALQQLQRSAREHGPELAKNVDAAQKMMQDLQFLTQRADEAASQLERVGAVAKQVAYRADSGRVVVTENVVAAASVGRDPLEELLDGLGGEKAHRVAGGGQAALALIGAPRDEVEAEEAVPMGASRAEEDLRRKLAQG